VVDVGVTAVAAVATDVPVRCILTLKIRDKSTTQLLNVFV
jgi:hypothetical protein